MLVINILLLNEYRKDDARTMVDQETKRSARERAARIIRGITVPPLLVSVLFILLFVFKEGVFSSPVELVLSLLFLVGIPLAAYPLSYVVPKLRRKGREAQRKLAFALNFIGYLGAVVYGIVAQVSAALFLIFLTYFVSVLILLLCNNVIRIRASGHACGTMGPLIFLVYFTGPYGIIPCVGIAISVAWSSIHLKRHTPRELILGALSALAAFLVSLFVVGLLL